MRRWRLRNGRRRRRGARSSGRADTAPSRGPDAAAESRCEVRFAVLQNVGGARVDTGY